MSHSKPDIDRLISLYLSYQASKAQRKELEQWILASEKNRTTFHRLEKIWAMSIPAAYDPKMDVVRDRIWENAVQKATPALTAAPDASPVVPGSGLRLFLLCFYWGLGCLPS